METGLLPGWVSGSGASSLRALSLRCSYSSIASLGVAHFRVADPQIVFACPSFPLYEVIDDIVRLLVSSAADRAAFGVEDFFDLKFLLVINEVRRRSGRDFLVGEVRRDVWG